MSQEVRAATRIECPVSAPLARRLSATEKLLSFAIRLLPIKHGKHRLLDKVFPKPWNRDSTNVVINYNGSKVCIDIDDLVGWHFAMIKSFDPEVAEVLLAAASEHSEDEVFWDIGANKGSCSYALAKQLPNAKIVAIEPQISLRRNCEFNLMEICPDRFEYYQVGIGVREEDMELVIPSDNAGKASLHAITRDPKDRRETIRIVPASMIFNESKFGWPTLVKIDVEGHEPQVIRSLAPAMQAKQCNAIVFETHWRRFNDFKAIMEVANEFEYDVFGISKSPLTTSLVRTSSPKSELSDYVMVRREFRVACKAINSMIMK